MSEKALELPLAMWIDLVWSKRRIVEIYINTAEWGPGIYGAEAAAQYHFGKSGKALTKAQAAQLAASTAEPGGAQCRQAGTEGAPPGPHDPQTGEFDGAVSGLPEAG